MIGIEVKGGLSDQLFSMLRGLRDADTMKLGQDVARILKEENERNIMAGINADGSETADLKESTIKRGRGGFGPPRAPRGRASRIVTMFEVAVARSGEHEVVVRAGWPGFGAARFMQEGTRHMVARPPAGLTPSTRAQLEEAAHRFGGDILGAKGGHV